MGSVLPPASPPLLSPEPLSAPARTSGLTISGTPGHDVLRASSPDDTLEGGAGDDRYIINSTRTVAREEADQGNDLVVASVDWTLGEHFERLILVGADDLSGSGNMLANTLRGTTGNNLLSGGAGNDFLNGHLGDDTLFGGDDDDQLLGGMGNDVLYGEAGNDVLKAGQGTGEQFLYGGTGNDTLSGGISDDWLHGDEGDDLIYASAGADTVDGGDGIDRFSADWSRSGADLRVDVSDASAVSVAKRHHLTSIEALSIATGRGDDTVRTGTAGSADYVSTGQGNDWIELGSSNNWGTQILAGAGDDTLLGASGDDGKYFWTHLGLSGGEGNDLIDGQGGNDWLVDEAGSDTLLGGSGDDTLVHAMNDGGSDYFDGGEGIDQLQADWSNLGGAVLVDLLSGSPLVIDGDTFTGFEALSILTGEGADTIRTGPGNAANYINTGAGDDLIELGSSNNRDTQVFAGQGQDTILGAEGDDGNYFWTGLGLSGGEGDDLIEGRGGNDRLVNEAGNDTLLGGSGDDVLVTFQNDGGSDYFDGGSGIDQLQADWSALDTGFVLDLRTEGATHVIDGDSFSAFESLGVTLSAEDDTLYTGVWGTADLVVAGDGDDLLILGSSNSLGSQIFGSLGNDTLIGADGDDGNYFWTGLGLSGGEGDDLIEGRGGNDRLVNEAGSDTLLGGAGNDTLSVNQEDGAEDSLDGGQDLDLLQADWSAMTTGIQLDLRGAGLNGMVAGDSFSNFEGLAITTGSGDDTLYTGTAGNADTLSTGAGDDFIELGSSNYLWTQVLAGAGNDTLIGADGDDGNYFWTGLGLSGGDGDDLIEGRGGHDLLVDEAGNDVLIGGSGDDTIYLGDGQDTVGLDSTQGRDVIVGFDSASDTVRIDAVALGIGNGDQLLDTAQQVSEGDSLQAHAELAVFTSDLGAWVDDVAAVVALIGGASSAYAIGQKALFVVDNATDSAAYLFTSDGNDASVESGELTLLVVMQGAYGGTALADWVFGA